MSKAQRPSRQVVIADIDQDGFLLSHFGPIRNVPTIPREQFVLRSRFDLALVACDGHVAVRKSYKGDGWSFLNELKALHLLGLAGCPVPAILDVDFENLVITLSYIPGPVLREELARKSALVRDRDVRTHDDFSYLDERQQWLRRIHEGRRVLHDVIDGRFVEELFSALQRIHGCGFILNDIKYGNIIIANATREPFLIDLDAAYQLPRFGAALSRIFRDRDVELFNLHFGTEKLTYERMRREITKLTPEDVYAPVYFGAGLRISNIWDVNVGYGRWHYILKNHLPPLRGKRILDLGANNGFNAIQMLRCGAREAVAIEADSKYIAQGRFIHGGFEWLDGTRYNLRYICGKMEDLPAMALGEFDVVLALCSLYYLDDETAAELVRHVSTITDVFVLQCNTATNIGRQDPRTYERASVASAQKILTDNGFPAIEVIAPYRYTRPLIIGRKKP